MDFSFGSDILKPQVIGLQNCVQYKNHQPMGFSEFTSQIQKTLYTILDYQLKILAWLGNKGSKMIY